jgi:hypothetical protein
MSGYAAAGTLGLIVQFTVFLFVFALSARRLGVSRSLADAGVVAVFGYALVISFASLLAIPWQGTNVMMAIAVSIMLAFTRVRVKLLDGLVLLVAAVQRAWIAVVIVGGVLLVHLTVAAVLPELSIDGQLYHGPALASIVQSGSLWGWSAVNEYIYYTDLTMAGGVNLATFAGDARFDHVLQLPHLLLLIFVINWALASRFSSPFARVSLATLMVSAPVIWLQPRILYVDLAYGTAVAATIFFIVLLKEFRRTDLVIGGILIAAVVATKPTGVLTGFFLFVVFVFVVLLRQRRVEKFRRTAANLGVAFLIPVLTGFSFYLRNFIEFRNPVYPVQASFGPVTLPGIIDLSIFASGERGSGFVDPARWTSYFDSIAFGMTHGVTKLDYDPRLGGFGFVALAVFVLVIGLIIVQFVLRLRSNGTGSLHLADWRVHLAIVGLAAAILLIQPSTFDARYVIGPTIALFVAALLTSTVALPSFLQVFAGALALTFVIGQITWTEMKMFPGLNVAQHLMIAPSWEQPNTPANPWGRGVQLAWLDETDDECFSIALQTQGGLTPTGMREASALGTLSYGLYGDRLCNEVFPISLEEIDGTDVTWVNAEINSADFLIMYDGDVDEWLRAFPGLKSCLIAIYAIPGSDTYPQDEIVLRNTCV